jgi:FMN phosphatase YigB (HAD superfamily)
VIRVKLAGSRAESGHAWRSGQVRGEEKNLPTRCRKNWTLQINRIRGSLLTNESRPHRLPPLGWQPPSIAWIQAVQRPQRPCEPLQPDPSLTSQKSFQKILASDCGPAELESPRMPPQPQVDFLYFDLGKVLIDFSYEIGARRLSELTGLPKDRFLQTVFGGGNQVAYETGLIETDEFARRVNRELQTQIPEPQLVAAATEIFWPNWQIIPLVTALSRAGWPLGILSNTCSAHWEYVTRNYRFLGHFFGPVILSYEVNAMKPAEAIYSAAARLAEAVPERIFFVDDRPENVSGAQAFGFQAILYESASQTAAELRRLGVACDY